MVRANPGAIACGTGALVNQAPAGLGPVGLRSPIAPCRACRGYGRTERVIVTQHGHALDRRDCVECFGSGIALGERP